MSRLSTTIDRWEVGDLSEWLHNAHAGEVLALDFLEPLGMSAADLARCIHVPENVIAQIVDGSRRLDGPIDLRLARYFRMSPGFFLGLQVDYELLEAKRALNGALDSIVPRAA